MKQRFCHAFCIIIAGIMLVSMLCGCVAQETVAPIAIQTTVATEPSMSSQTMTTIPQASEGVVEVLGSSSEEPVSVEPSMELSPVVNATPVPTITPEEIVVADDLSDTQRNSISMLNYLVVLTQEINESKNSRLYLEEIYSSLISNTAPEAIDTMTLDQINGILDNLEEYRLIAQKRERLQYIYEQNQAQAMRDAIPSPLGLMSAVQSFGLGKMAASLVYMAIDSYTSYESSSSAAELQYLQNGWALDDAGAQVLHNSRKQAFNYMVQMVNVNDLPGDIALSEKAVEDFVSWSANSNPVQVIQFLENNVETYQAFGTYWLTLARCYYENGDYQECLSAISAYEELGISIFRKDFGFSETLPLAIVAAKEVLSEEEYIACAEHYADSICENTEDDNWALRYFAAQTYIELYALTEDLSYLEQAYAIALNNVNTLVGEQRALNTAYLAPIAKVSVPEGASKDEKKEIQAYNKMLEEERKTALPPLYEPLLLNCELLFALAEELTVSEEQWTRIDRILHNNGEALFLADPIDQMFQVDGMGQSPTLENITFDGNEIILPAALMSAEGTITVTIEQNGESTSFSDWLLLEVERDDDAGLDAFMAVYTSDAIEDFDFAPGAVINVSVAARASGDTEPIQIVFHSIEQTRLYVFDSLIFERVNHE